MIPAHKGLFKDPTAEAQEFVVNDEIQSERSGPNLFYWVGFGVAAYIGTAVVAFVIWGIVSFLTSTPTEKPEMDPYTGRPVVTKPYDPAGIEPLGDF